MENRNNKERKKKKMNNSDSTKHLEHGPGALVE